MNSQQISDEIMNDIEKDKLIAFCKDEIMFQAVKKYILYYLYQGIAQQGKPFNGGINYALQLAWERQGGVLGSNGQVVAYVPNDDARLGADLRALARGINIIESGFKEISDIVPPVVEEKKNDNVAL